MRTSLTAGAVVLGCFEIKRPLGQGAFARTYLAEQRDVGRLAVIKVPRAKLLTAEFEQWTRRRFSVEIAAAGRIKHPNLVTIYTAGEIEGLPALAMEYLEGETMETWLHRRHSPDNSLAADLTLQLLDVIVALHEAGIVHRDVSPCNIIVEQGRGGRLQARLLDFGIAHIEGHRERTNGPIGTPRYMAPEMVRGQWSAKSDVFGLGSILWWLWTGREYLDFLSTSDEILEHHRTQVHPPDPRHADGQLSATVARLIGRMLHPDQARRPASAEIQSDWLDVLAEADGKPAAGLASTSNVERDPRSGAGPTTDEPFERSDS